MVSVQINLMPSRNTSSYSERRARALLAAWNSASLERLETVLYRPAPPAPHGAAPDEEERREMVAEVENALRCWIEESAGRNEAALLTALKLLRHLAGCESLRTLQELSPLLAHV